MKPETALQTLLSATTVFLVDICSNNIVSKTCTCKYHTNVDECCICLKLRMFVTNVWAMH